MTEQIETTEATTEKPAAAEQPAGGSATVETKPAEVAAKPEAGKTMAEGAPQTEEQAKIEAKWRDDWREALANGDDKALTRLKRFQSPENVFKSWAELDRKLATGSIKNTLPENPTPEDIAAYRKSWDVPDKPEDYGIEIPEALQLLDPEKESVSMFLKDMHDSHAPKAFVKQAWNTYTKVREAELQQIYEGAQEKTVNNRATMKSEWGRDYDRNMRLVNSDVISTLGSEEAAKRLAGMTFIDGTKLGDDPDFLRYVASKALATTAEDDLLITSERPGTTGDSVQKQIDDIQELMFGNDEAKRKFHSPEVQAKYKKLYAIKAAMGNRAA